ncbi:hypothetical protein Tco_0267258 [Tanacetum coccineum]
MKLNPKKCSFGVEEGPFLGHLITKQGIKANPMKIKAVTELEQPRALKDIQSLNGKLAALSRFLSKGTERSLPFFKVLKSCKGKKTIHWTDEADKAFKEIKKFIQALPMLTAPRAGETLTMVLQGAELNYHALEKLISALVHATRRLQRYFQAHTIMVPTDERETPVDFLPEIPIDDSENDVKEKEVSDPSNEWKLYTDKASSSDEYEALLAELRIAQEMEITFDREDLNVVYQLVMDRLQDEIPEGFDGVLWGDLMVMFNPDDENKFWNSQQDWNIKKYPLRKKVMVQMLKLKLESEEDSTMALELIRLIKKLLAELEPKE